MKLNLLGLLALVCAGHVIGADAPKKFSAGEFQFTAPSGWQWVESTSPMRKAQLKITGADSAQTAEVVFFHFGESNAGGIQANVDRWISQFEEPREKLKPKIDATTVGKHKVTYVQAEGTYLAGMPGGPKTRQPGTRLQGAILESEQGSVFIKMTGPVALVNDNASAFNGSRSA